MGGVGVAPSSAGWAVEGALQAAMMQASRIAARRNPKGRPLAGALSANLTKSIHHPVQAAYKEMAADQGGGGPYFSNGIAPGRTARLPVERVEVAIA